MTTTSYTLEAIEAYGVVVRTADKPDETNYDWYLLGVTLWGDNRYTCTVGYIDLPNGTFALRNMNSTSTSVQTMSLRWIGIHK